MKDVNRENLSFDSVSYGYEEGKVRFWNIIYNVLKCLGIGTTIAMLVTFGVSVQLAVVVASLVVGMSAVKVFGVMPAKKRLEAENLSKVNFMLELAENDVIVDANDFDLSKVATYDAREDAKIVIPERDENGELLETEHVYGRVGNKYKYYMFKDRDEQEHLLVCDQEFYERKRLLADGTDGYVNIIANRIRYGLLEENDLEALPEEVKRSVYDCLIRQSYEKKKIRRR